MTTTDWQAREVPRALTPERLAALVDREVERSDSMLFTVTAREELDAIGRSQQLRDQAFAHQVRVIAAAHSRASQRDREFAVDELAVAFNVGLSTAYRLQQQALGLSALPGMVEAIEASWLSERHALAVLRELDEVEQLTFEQRIAVVTIVLARLCGQTPHELAKLTRKLILLIDLDAAQARQDQATAHRRVRFWPAVNGQAVCQTIGPLEKIAAVEASLKAWLREHPKAADDPRSQDERAFDLYVSLLTGETEPGSWQAQLITPFSTAAGGNLELAEIPGYGPILPSTARDLLEDAEWTQVAVDENGVVIAVGDPTPAPRSASPQRADAPPSAAKTRMQENWELSLAQLMSQPPKQRLMPQQLGSAGYATPGRLRRYLQARDRTCVFPGCHRRITDVDHRIPWPLGPTAAWNLQLLCRHHHRAKQAVFTVELTPEGDYLWTTRGGWQFIRHRQGY